jgi:hypothetical protein
MGVLSLGKIRTSGLGHRICVFNAFPESRNIRPDSAGLSERVFGVRSWTLRAGAAQRIQ